MARMASADTSRLEARPSITLPVSGMSLPRTAGPARNYEPLAELGLAALTVALGVLLFLCLQRTVHICPTQFLP